jgi:hypothetical protein
MGRMMEVLERMSQMGVGNLEAHWVLGRLAADHPAWLAEALDALELKRQKDAAEPPADGRAAA